MSVLAVLSRHRAAAGFAGGVATCVVLGSGVALAAIPSTATGSITACVSRSSGAVRIVDFQAGKRCTTRERTIAWSKGLRYRGTWSGKATYAPLDVVSHNGASYLARVPSTAKSPTTAAYWGPLALRGLAGPRGPMGVAGAAGAPGAPGTNGLNGVPGRDGSDGATGAVGATGPAGPVGPAGPQGPAGPTGATGATGATGQQGPAGVLGYEMVKQQVVVPSGATVVAETTCPAGKVPTGGSAYVGTIYAGHGNASAAYVPESGPNTTGTGWLTTLVVVAPTDPTTFTTVVICVSAGS